MGEISKADVGWPTVGLGIAASFILVVLLTGLPGFGGGAIGFLAVLAPKFGFVAAAYFFGALPPSLGALYCRLASVDYHTPKRDALLIGLIALFFMLKGSGLLSAPQLSSVFFLIVGSVLYLLLRGRIPDSFESLADYALGAAVLCIPVLMILGALYVLEYSLLASSALLILGIGGLAYILFWRREEPGPRK